MNTEKDLPRPPVDISSRIRAALSKLVPEAEEEDDPKQRDAAFRELHSLGSQIGSYQAASLIEDWLRNARRRKLGNHIRQQIYDVVSFFLHDHLLEEIRAAGQNPGSLGPTLFSGFVSELIQSTFSGSAPRAGCEQYINTLDALCDQALVSPRPLRMAGQDPGENVECSLRDW